MYIVASANGSSLRQKLQYPFDQSKIRNAREELQKAIQILNVAITSDAAYGSVDAPQVASRHRPRRSRQATVEDVSDISPRSQRLLAGGSANAQDDLQDIVQSQRLTSSPESVQGAFRRPGRAETIEIPPEEHLMPVTPEVSNANLRNSTDSSLRSHVSRSSFNSVGSLPPTSAGQPPTSPTSAPSGEGSLFNRTLSSYRTANETDASSIGESEDTEQIEIDPEDRDEICEVLQNHTAFQKIEPRFRSEAEHFKARTDLEEWISCAIWWLLKARGVSEVLDKQQTLKIQRRNEWPVKISREQAAVDLLKACFIVKYVVFSAENARRPVKNYVWKSAKDLISAVQDELHLDDTLQLLRQFDPDNARLHLSFSEKRYQPIEAETWLPAALDDVESSRRWLTVHTDHAGDRKERVLLRFFVNAQIGEEKQRRKSPSAPYLFILWSQHGRSEVLVSLANQVGTVNLCCTLTEQDIVKHEEHTPSSLEFRLTFPSQDTIIQFLSSAELEEFLDCPKNFFRATKERDTNAEEFLVFRDGLQSFERRTSTQGPRSSISGAVVTQAHSSCEISLYELIPSECWKTQRRLVISSAFDAKEPWCHSEWLPISNVRVQGEGRDVELCWSDCNQLQKTSNGYYGYEFSLVHKPNSPNIVIAFQFHDAAAASEFKAAILRPWVTPFETESLKCKLSFGTAGGSDDSLMRAPVGQELSIWQMMDADTTKRQSYYSIVYIKRAPPTGFVTKVYFMHRDVDFAVEQAGEKSMSLQALRIPLPVSNVRRKKWQPKDETGVCEDVEWAFDDDTFHFENDGDIEKFMNALIGWQLIFCCRALQMQCGSSVNPGSWKQKNVIVTAWGTPADAEVNRGVRVAMRWMGEAHNEKDFRWTTADISTAANCIHGSSPTKIILKDVQLSRGAQLDTITLAAVNDAGRFEKQKKTLTLSMPDVTAVTALQMAVNKHISPISSQPEDPSVLYRPISSMTMTSDSKSSRDPSKFLRL